jgi:Flp pilus assembly protein TadG
MKNIFSRLLYKISKRLRSGEKNGRLERGQVLVIVTLSVISLVAIVGLAVDTGLLYLNHGKLRRAVDAAALAASSQFREGYSTAEMSKSAVEFLKLNGINDPSATVQTCATNPGDPTLCTTPRRKLVRVHATSITRLAFLPVIGIRTATITASAVSEAASMDVVLVIDTSDSMTYDAPVGDPMRDPSQCNPVHNCHPFEEVKGAAKAFVDQLYFPYDRVSVVTFSDSAHVDLGFSDRKSDIIAAINGLNVINPPVCPTASGPCRVYEGYPPTPADLNHDGVIDYYGFDCPVYHLTGNPDTCGTTSIGKGLLFAGDEFANPATFRQESLWVVILLTDGATNGPFYVCPNSTWTNPFCRDNHADTRHCFTADDTSCLAKGGVFDPNDYDTDDYARDMADFVSEDQHALIFTIGLGQLVQNSIPINASGEGAGEQLLKYAADTGGGKYYYAPGGNQLRDIFLDIAQNLATRLTQ